MSNSFNISVAPEIAAVAAVVDNIHDVDLPAVSALVTAVDIVVDDIHDNDIPAVGAMINVVDAVVDDIRDNDLPAVSALITAVDTVVDAIRAVDVAGINTNIDAINIRGQLRRVYDSKDTVGLETVINITGGSGKLVEIELDEEAGGCAFCKITVDGIVSNQLTGTDGTNEFVAYLSSPNVLLEIVTVPGAFNLNIEYRNSLKVEYGTDTATKSAYIGVIYQED